MASASSFLGRLDGRPPRYRTPSPPRRAVEPISPSFNPDFRIAWNERSAFRPSNYMRDTYSQGNGSSNANPQRHPPSNGSPASHSKPGHAHHRTSSSIETLATIALATSPTFAPLPYEGPQIDTSAHSPTLFPPTEDDFERPAKRARSEKVVSPILERVDNRPVTSHVSVPDSMTTDAELLLNFARPNNFGPVPQNRQPVTTVNGAYHHHYAMDTKWLTPVAFEGSAQVSPLSQVSEYGISPSRIRSHSDGSAAIARPVIPGLRPNTSSSTLPSISWDMHDAKDNGHQDFRTLPDGYGKVIRSQPRHASTSAVIMNVLPEAKEEEVDSDDSSQASCAACNLVRMNIHGEDQGEVTWINCDGCKRWFHIACAGFKNDREVRTVDKFICRDCRPVHGQTTFVRKSSRARTAIDYAGLNQGLVKASTDSNEHHYIQPIKDGTIRFLPENFPRMRAELVTAEFFERGVGMTQPIVIPAAFNPRTPIPPNEVDTKFEDLISEAPTQEMFDELLEHLPDVTEPEVVIDCGQDVLDMVIPQGLTVRAVAELYGPEEKVEVIDVKSQQGEEKRWNMQKWAEYYESTGSKIVRNVISLEVSQSPLGRLIRRPKVVRDLDLQDSVWPEELKAIGDYPKVQFYCLMSVADCYTDFHIDFGGSSVYYTILKGKKTFFFIPPKEQHLKKYEEWCNSPAQDTTFLGDQTKECYRVDLEEGDTMLIPAGWIHAVWTPENSLVIGGNFLTRMNYGMQIKVAKIEKDTKVPRKFRYPFFQKIQWYTAMKYLDEDPIPASVLDAFARDENYRFYRQFPIYYEFGAQTNSAVSGSGYYNARFYSQAELEGLPELLRYLFRTAMIAGGYSVDGVTMEAKNAVKRSIPKMQADALEVVKKFAIWVAWKRGNEHAPQWTRPGAILSNFKLEQVEKRPAGRPSRRSERHADAQRMYAERQSLRRMSDQPPEVSTSLLNGTVSTASEVDAQIPLQGSPPNTAVKEEPLKPPRTINKSSGLGPKRVACDACRKRRIRCRHKDEYNELGTGPAISRPPPANMFNPVDIQNQSILARDAASVLNALASVATETGMYEGSQGLGLDRMDGYAGESSNSSLLGIQGSTIPQPLDGISNGINSGKKGRSKACDECRKSKRRCIHDEFGRIDPIKAQERSKPRGASSTKRPRPSDDGATTSTPNKKPRQELTSDHSREDHDTPMGDLSVVSLLDADSRGLIGAGGHQLPSTVQSPPAESPEQPKNNLHLDHVSYASPPAVKADVDSNSVAAMAVQATEPAVSLVSPPTSLAGDIDLVSRHRHEEMQETVDVDHDALHTPTSSSRHSSRQPRQVERYVPQVPPAKLTTKQASSSTRHAASSGIKSSSAPSSTMKKPASRPTSSHKTSASSAHDKMSVSAVSPQVSQSKGVKRERASFGETGADEESLRLIRELQEQDFGLRRRAARV